jgi:hypothetical protein
MATNSRRKAKEIIEDVAVDTGIVLTEAKVEKLSSDDLLKCETLSRDITNSRLLMNLEEQSLRNMILESELLKNKIEKQRLLVREKAESYENEKKMYRLYVEDMWARYGFDPNSTSVGYNDTTGEIIVT